MKIVQWIKNLPTMYPRMRKYGFKYAFNKDFRRKCKNRERTLKRRETCGSGWVPKKRRPIKTHLFYKHGNKCFWCGEKMTFIDATIDHVEPCSEKRNNKISNLRLIHDSCRVERDRALHKGVLIN